MIPLWNNSRGSFTASWSGFVQEEKLWWWGKQSSLTPSRLIITGFTEGKYFFTLPGNKVKPAFLQGVVVNQMVKLEGRTIAQAGSFKILTRPARSSFEVKVHPRWPICRPGDGSSEVVIFGEKDATRDFSAQMSLL